MEKQIPDAGFEKVREVHLHREALTTTLRMPQVHVQHRFDNPEEPFHSTCRPVAASASNLSPLSKSSFTGGHRHLQVDLP